MDPNVKPGALVELGDGRVATVRFVGETSFREGTWIGVELDDPSGKNDGSVQGKRYFDCAPLHGMFLQRINKVLEAAPPALPKPAPTPAKSNGRAVAPPNRRASTIQPSKPLPPPTSRTSTASPAKRASTIAPASTRKSIVPSNRTSTINAPPTKPKPTGSTSNSASTRSGSSRLSMGPTRKPAAPTEASQKASTQSGSTLATPKPTPASNKKVEELEAMIKVLERKRAEDRENLKKLEHLEQEKSRLEAIITKLQAKYQPQTQENQELKRTLKDAEAKFEELESLQAEHDSIVEMALLDKEMAEEHAEAYKTELDMVKSRIEELQLENEILKEENEELGNEMSPEERTSKGWLQMERENDRLREALIRLRDITQENEAELKEQVASLQQEVEELGNIKEKYDNTKAKCLEAEADIDDLRQQLEAALGAEEIIEQLTEKNETLVEQVDELKNTIDDLESLKEVSDELEVNHIETEKQLQDEIDFKDFQVAEQLRRGAQQDEMIADQEYTITKFRELVTNMQTDLEGLRTSKEITDTEAQHMEEKSREMMDLNRQLQQSATSSKIKTIDMELRKLEAQEAAEHLAIVQLFLPEAFHSERDSVLALLRFKRVGFKASLLHGFVKDKLTSSKKTIHEEDIFDACDVLDKLTYMSSMCERFINRICACSIEQFAKFEGALYDLEPIERGLNGYIDLLKKDDLREKQVAEQLHRSCAVIAHLAEYHLSDGDLSTFADEVLMRTQLTQSHLDSTSSALSILINEVQVKVPALAEDETEDDLLQFLRKGDQMVTHSRSAKVIVGKAVRSLQDLKARSLSLGKNTNAAFEKALLAAEDLAEYTRKLGENVFNILHEEGRVEPLTFSSIRPIICSTANDVFSSDTRMVNETEPFATIATRLESLTTMIMDLAAISADLENTAEFERLPAPWVLRSKELAAAKIVSIDAEDEMRRLREESQAQKRDINVRKQELEERDVKIEVLEKRISDAIQKAAAAKRLEEAMAHNTATLQQIRQDLLERNQLVDKLRADKERALHTAEQYRKQSGELGHSRGDTTLSADQFEEMELLREKVDILGKTNKYLRETNRRQQRESEAKVSSWLRATLAPTSPRYFASNNPQAEIDMAMRDHAALALSPYVHIAPPKLAWQPRKETPAFVLAEEETKLSEVWAGWESAVFTSRVTSIQV